MPWYENFSGQRLWYEDQGSGTPILLLHGWCMTSSVWQLQRESLSADYRIITPDLRGLGHSSALSDDCTLESFVSDTLALVERLKLTSLILAGWSMGAEVAVMAARTINVPVAGLVLVSGTPSFSLRDDFPYGLGRVEAEGMALKVRRNVDRAFAGFTENMFAPGELDDTGVAGRVRDILSVLPTPDTNVALQSLKSLTESDIRPLFQDLDLPTLIINGDNDPICLPGASQWMASRLSSSLHTVFSGAGHAPFLTMPDTFNTCLRHFIEKLQLRSTGEKNC